MIGVNLSGAEFGKIGGKFGWDYTYPTAGDIQYYAARGVELVRLPIKWERIQPTANGELDAAELGRLTKFLTQADAAGVKVVIDIHNFGKYYGDKIGSADVPISQFADLWKKIATAVGDMPAVAGYDLMNEPNGLATSATWPNAAQAAVDAIRTVDAKTAVYVEGSSYANLKDWSKTNALLDIKDPANNVVYEAHMYFDKWSSGTYKGSYDAEGASPDMAASMMSDFVNWLDKKGAKGFIGEVAVPDSDPRWLTVLDNAYKVMAANDIDSAYWGAGPWWGNYELALRNQDGTASAQLAVVEKWAAAAKTAAQTPGAAPAEPVAADQLFAGTMGHEIMKGGAGNDRFVFSTGNDSYVGGAGTDTLDLSAQSRGASIDLAAGTVSGAVGTAALREIENVIGTAGSDRIYGDAGANMLTGGGGSDTLDGRAGADRMVGGTGDDIYVVDNAGDIVVEAAGQGNDTVRSSLATYVMTDNVEKLELIGGGLDATGNASSNQMFGNEADNMLSGQGGNDRLYGRDGNDRLYGGDGIDVLYGQTGNDLLDGGAGNDTLDGGIGADRMIGGTGNDTFIVDDAGDVVVEVANGGTDTVKSSVASYAMTENVENLIVTATTAASVTGNASANTITGAAADDMLSGLGGNDVLRGGAGNDRLFGGDGNDTLEGGTGADTLTGGEGKDLFRFTATDQSTTAARDIIADFLSGTDRIDVSGIDASATKAGNQAFTLIGTGAFTKAEGQLRYEVQKASDGHSFTLVQADANGDGTADFALVLDHYAAGLKTADFVL